MRVGAPTQTDLSRKISGGYARQVMETELTRKIKTACHGFKPEMPTQLRTIRYADEVWTPSGIVDVIRFEDYVEKDNSFCDLIHAEEVYAGKELDTKRSMHGALLGRCKVDGETYPNRHCRGCFFERHRYEVGMLVTCYEVKISVSDFKSPNGHNFHGNRNYYAVSSDIYEQIREMVPDGIGIIVYYEKTGAMRVKKECEFREISFELKTELLYNALKKWCDAETYFKKNTY